MRPVSWETFLDTTSGLLEGKRICLVRGKARYIKRNSCISLACVQVVMNILLVYFSFSSCWFFFVTSVSCI